MPKALERKLFREGRKRGFSSDRLNAYVYGTLRNIGWIPRKQRKKK